MKKAFVPLLIAICLLSIAGNVILYLRYSSQRPLMRIGSQTIRVNDYRNRIDYEFGKQVLTKMAFTMLVMQAAAKENVVPTPEQVKERLAAIERRTPKALEEAHLHPEKMKEVERDITTDMALENLAVKGVRVSDEQARKFYDDNKNLFLLPAQARSTIVVASNAVDASTAAELLKNNVSLMVIAKQPGLQVVGVNGYQPNWDSLAMTTRTNLAAAVAMTPVHAVKTVAAGNLFVVVRVEERNVAGVPPFEKIKPTVIQMAKMQKAPSKQVALARLYKSGGITFEAPRYAEYFRDIEQLSKQAP